MSTAQPRDSCHPKPRDRSQIILLDVVSNLETYTISILETDTPLFCKSPSQRQLRKCELVRYLKYRDKLKVTLQTEKTKPMADFLLVGERDAHRLPPLETAFDTTLVQHGSIHSIVLPLPRTFRTDSVSESPLLKFQLYS